MDTSTDLKRGSIRAGNLEFHYLEVGSGPLALCLHGFPDSPWTFRHMLPQLARAGYRAVAPFMRGYAPTQVPPDEDCSIEALASDVNALHEALGGDSSAVLVAHDWGAVSAWGALPKEPARWRRAVIASIPPYGYVNHDFKQLQRSFYFWLFQMDAADGIVAANNMAFIDGLWGEWSPGYDAAYDLTKAKECLSRPENLRAALGYYREDENPSRFGRSEWAKRAKAAWGRPVPQPVLYLHGANDGCTALEAVAMDALPKHLGPGSQVEAFPGVGHFLWVQKPTETTERVLRFLKA